MKLIRKGRLMLKVIWLNLYTSLKKIAVKSIHIQIYNLTGNMHFWT